MWIVGNLSSDHLNRFNSQGYLVMDSFSSPEGVESMKKRMDQLLDDFDCSSTASIFSTKNQVDIYAKKEYLFLWVSLPATY